MGFTQEEHMNQAPETPPTDPSQMSPYWQGVYAAGVEAERARCSSIAMAERNRLIKFDTYMTDFSAMTAAFILLRIDPTLPKDDEKTDDE